MVSFKQRIEQGFESMARFIFKFRWLFIAIMLVLAVGSASQLKKLTIDMSDEGFLHPALPLPINRNLLWVLTFPMPT